MHHYSPRTYYLGQQLLKNFGLWAAARHLKNLGIPVETAVEYLCVRKSNAR